jgi:D-alanine-D-alanine ligase
MSLLCVLHLVGSPINQFYCELSRLYAQDCLEHTANSLSYKFHIAYVSPGGFWRFPDSLSPKAIAAAEPLSLVQAMQVLMDLKIDVMLPHMFCIPGMTHYRALFDLLQIPYVGNSPDVMALVTHKARTKSVVAAAGVNVPPGELLRPNQVPTIVPPAVIKPVDIDNSLGVTLVKDAADYDAALKTAFGYADEVIVESFIELGREVRCGLIVQNGQLICLPLEEYLMDANTRPIRSYADKLQQDDRGILSPVAKDNRLSWIVDPSDPITERVWHAAQTCHLALGCRHYSLFDFRIDPTGEPWFLEAGLYCSFARKSVISAMVKAAGIALDRFLQIMIESALQEPERLVSGLYPVAAKEWSRARG